MAITRLVLVRHGESLSQVHDRSDSHLCQGLSERGRAQAAALRDRWTHNDELGPVSVIYTSLMKRAQETAEIIAPAMDNPPIYSSCDLCEVHTGEADGLTMAEMAKLYPADRNTWPPFEIPDAEKWVDMTDRVDAELERVASAHKGETVVLSCHGGVIAHSMVALLNTGPFGSKRAWLLADNASITEWLRDDETTDWRGSRWGLIRYNDAFHTLGI